MNINLLNTVKRIVAEQGELILANPQRLKGFVADYAKNEPKEDRLAFGRCIEAGAYARFKNTRSDAERRQLKAALLPQIQAASGQNAAVCQNALDILEAVLFAAPSTLSASPPYMPMQPPAPQSAPPAYAPQTAPYQSMPQTVPGQKTAFSISKKTALFGVAAGGGALVGDLIYSILEDSLYYSNRIVAMAICGACLGLGISVGLFIIQTLSAKRKLDSNLLIKTILIGLASGMVSVGFVQFIFNYTQQISTTVRHITNALLWGVMAAGLGLGASFYVPNYPPKRAVLAGAAGGTLGGIIYVALLSSGSNAGSIIGVIILGAAIGLAISFIEEALREAWLTIIWSKNEMTTVSLGEKPIVAGSTREADIYLPRRPSEPAVPVRAVFSIENGAVIVDDRLTGTRRQSQNGERIDLGRVSIIVNTKAQ